VAEEVPAETLSRYPCGLAMDAEVAKIASKNLTTSDGGTAGATPDDAKQERRVEV
jgi:hypothetical protein